MVSAILIAMIHIIQYKNEKKAVEAPRTATVGDVVELGWPGVTWNPDFNWADVTSIASGKKALKRFLDGN